MASAICALYCLSLRRKPQGTLGTSTRVKVFSSSQECQDTDLPWSRARWDNDTHQQTSTSATNLSTGRRRTTCVTHHSNHDRHKQGGPWSTMTITTTTQNEEGERERSSTNQKEEDGKSTTHKERGRKEQHPTGAS